MDRSVVIDCFPESAEKYRDGYAVVVIDVIRATTTATTAVSLGRRVFPAQTTDEAPTENPTNTEINKPHRLTANALR